MTMTLWPPQKQAGDEMWETYKRRTARPGLLEEEAAAERAKLPQPSTGETSSRRGKLSENPQPERDA